MIQFKLAGRMILLDRTTALCAAAFFAPTLLVLAASDVKSAAGPAMTMAKSPSPSTADPASLTIITRKLTDAEREAAKRCEALAKGVTGESPFYYPQAHAPVVAAPTPAPTPVASAPVAAPQQPPPAPSFSISSIFRTADGAALAIVHGKIRRVGDDLGNGWTLTAVDPDARTITVSHAASEPVTLSLKR